MKISSPALFARSLGILRWSPSIFGIITVLATSVLDAEPVTMERDNLRNVRYGEIIVVTGEQMAFTGHVYNTIGLNECPEAQWKALDPARLKEEFKARAIIMNGPRYCLMDTNTFSNPGEVASFDGLKARHLADVSISPAVVLRGHSKPYTENKVSRTTKFVFRKGLPVYELVSPKGVVYVMQSYSQTVDPKLGESDLAKLGDRLKLPKGWQYRVRTPATDTILQTSGTAYVLQDELENSYQRAAQ